MNDKESSVKHFEFLREGLYLYLFICVCFVMDILNFLNSDISLIQEFHHALRIYIELKHEPHEIIYYIATIISNVENEIVGCI